jgi:NDP-sugar pyrophosphorylase family protein
MENKFIPLQRVLSKFSKSQSVENVTGVILAAGFGKRMGDLTRTIPKPLLPVLNCPLLGWNIAQMGIVNISNIIINTHYLSTEFEPLKPIVTDAGIKLHLYPEQELSGPFGGVLACSTMAQDKDDLLVFAGDGLYDVNIQRMLNTHRQHNADLTIGMATVSDGSRYGVLEINNESLVQAMTEKPIGIGPVKTASCGVYVVSSSLVKYMIDEPRPLDWIDVVSSLLAKKRRIVAESVDWWMDAGNPTDLLALNLFMLTDEEALDLIADRVKEITHAAVWKQGVVLGIQHTQFEGVVLLGSDVVLDRDIVIQNSVIGDNVKIGHSSEIRNSVIFSGAIIPRNTLIVDTIQA